MLRINNIKLSLDVDENVLIEKAAKILKIEKSKIKKFAIAKKSIDARNKSDVFYVYSIEAYVDNEEKYRKYKNVQIFKKANYEINIPAKDMEKRPVIVGSGPCGLFAGLILARAGQRPIIIERGKDVIKRSADVERFFTKGELDINSNVQFGEGGAGTFSDGKLTTGINDQRIKFILEEFVKFSAPKEIIYSGKPHIGTDRLIKVMENMRKEIEDRGGEYKFSTKMVGISHENHNLKAIKVEDLENNNIYEIETNDCILAIGHSARDSFYMLYETGVRIMQKAFAVGVRIEHSQRMINTSQYGEFAEKLPAAEYKLNTHLENGRGAYTFCMCPGGIVVAAASEENTVVTNGMSNYKRDGENANSALLVNVYSEDFKSDHPLAGIELQRELEKSAFINGGGNYHAPAQLVGDFLNNISSGEIMDVKPSYPIGVKMGNLNSFLPEFLTDGIKNAIIDMDKKLKGFNSYGAVLTGIESRSSSPVRIYRDNDYNSNIKGLYPLGEGAGYAGGIVSAAVDGIKCSEMIVSRLK